MSAAVRYAAVLREQLPKADVEAFYDILGSLRGGECSDVAEQRKKIAELHEFLRLRIDSAVILRDLRLLVPRSQREWFEGEFKSTDALRQSRSSAAEDGEASDFLEQRVNTWLSESGGDGSLTADEMHQRASEIVVDSRRGGKYTDASIPHAFLRLFFGQQQQQQ